MAEAWVNRIVGQGEEDPEQLAANPSNWRIHSKVQQEALAGVLDKVGFVSGVIVNKRTGFVVDGHLRVSLALRKHQPTIPVQYIDVTEEEEMLILATLDPLAALAVTDTDKLGELLRKLSEDDARIVALLDGKPTGQEADATIDLDRASELNEKWKVDVGQLWGAGEHRMVCGDCSDQTIVDLVMQGEKAFLGVTSPPYAVGKEYEADVSFDEHLKLLRGVADTALNVIEPGGFFFVNFGEIAPQSHAGKLTGSKRQCLYPISRDYWEIFHVERGMDLYAQRIWYKPFNRLQQPFWTYHTSIPHYQEWEHIWTWRLPGGEGDRVFDWDISVHAIWDTRQEATEDKPLTRHVAAFPVCLPERAIRAHSDIGAIVWEPFCGSGTTLVACERLGRKGRGIEIDPGYVAVALERLESIGLKPELLDSP